MLGLPDGASQEEVRRAYRRLVMARHPDRLGPSDAKQRAQATTYMQELNAAYARLTVPNTRPRVSEPPRREAPSIRSHRWPRAWRARQLRSYPDAAPSLGAFRFAPSVLLVLLLLVFLALTVLEPREDRGVRGRSIDVLRIMDDQEPSQPACPSRIDCTRGGASFGRDTTR